MTTEVVKSKAKKPAAPNTKPAKKTETPVSERTIRWVILGVLVARFLLTLLPSHKVDMGGYDYWSHHLADPFRGFKGFYNSDINDNSGLWVVYGPAYMYLLLISGKIAAWFQVSDLTHEFLIKSWAILFEFAGAYLIYLIAKSLGKPKTGFWVAVAYVMNPAIFINSSIWGQFDSLVATILLGVVYCFCIKKPVYAAILYFISVMTKPQSIFLLPLVAYVFFFQDLQWKKVFSSKEECKAYFNKDYWLKILYGVI
jgi:Gpi18-like mannosyltransferase